MNTCSPRLRVRRWLLSAMVAVAVPGGLLTIGAGSALAADPVNDGGTIEVGPTPVTPSVPQVCVAACASVINGLGGNPPNMLNPAPLPPAPVTVPVNSAPLNGGAPPPPTGGGVSYTLPGATGNLPAGGVIPTGTSSGSGGGGGGLLLDEGFGDF